MQRETILKYVLGKTLNWLTVESDIISVVWMYASHTSVLSHWHPLEQSGQSKVT